LPANGWKLFTALGLTVAVIAGGFCFGGEWGKIAGSAWQVLPFSVLAVCAYLGLERNWAKVLALVVLAVIILGAGLMTALMALLVVLESELIAGPEKRPTLDMSAVINLALVSAGIALATLLAATGFIPGVRRALARILPIDPDSFVHTVALVAVVALTLNCFVPLLVLSAPPLLSAVRVLEAQEADLTQGRGPGGMLLDELYGLVWLLPGAIFAVGFGVRRNLKEALQRLGLQVPTWRQVAAAVGLAMVLVIALTVLSASIDWAWDLLGWPQTDTKSFEKLMTPFLSPMGAVVLGVVAGLGEELAVRGVLQPRLGMLLSNLFFTGLHAFQYNWDALLAVFLLGLLFAMIRKKTNTTTSAIVHGTYDFSLTMAVVLQIPWLSE